MDDLIPFPAVKEPSDLTPATEKSQDSVHETSSSKLTSSDKLSALPPSGGVPRSTQLRSSSSQRHHRHSLDAAVSLPSYTTRDLETIRYDSWGPPRQRRDANASFSRNFHSGDSSPGKQTPMQRTSLDGERGSQPPAKRVGQAFPKLVGGRASDPSASPNPNKQPGIMDRLEASSVPPSHSHPHSRATSPLRLFHQWSSGMHRNHRHAAKEEPFVPVNPFKMRRKKKFTLAGILSPPPSPDIELSSASSGPYECEDIIPVASMKAFLEDAHCFLTETLPRQLYLNMLLRIPIMYFSRVARIFEDAEISRPDIQRMIDAMCNDKVKEQPMQSPEARAIQSGPGSSNLSPSHLSLVDVDLPLPFPDEWTPTSVSPSLFRFKHSWETFIDSLIREWKTLNVVSALLSSAIISIFQVPEAARDPITRNLALISLVSALMSLTYGCMYIVRFAAMRSMFRASRWADEARKTKTLIWWNVWVMLAMPAVWIAWAMLFFFGAILSFVWRTGAESDPEERPPIPDKAALGPRIVITAVFALGMVYLVMIIRTLKRYGGGPHSSSIQGMFQSGRYGIATAGGVETSGPGVMPGLSRFKTPESDKETEPRGRKRQRLDHAGILHAPVSSGSAKEAAELPAKGSLKGNLKDGSVSVSVKLRAGSSESI